MSPTFLINAIGELAMYVILSVIRVALGVSSIIGVALLFLFGFLGASHDVGLGGRVVADEPATNASFFTDQL